MNTGDVDRWTPERLGAMRTCGDELADRSIAQAAALDGEITKISRAFRSFAADDAEIAPDAPRELLDFAAATRRLPPGLDAARVERGARVLLDNATLCALVLLLKSLPSGYAAPRLSTILAATGNLERRPYRRALGVLQMLVNISHRHAFTDGGRAVVTAQKMRLLHAGIRRLVPQKLPGYGERFDTPVSQLDMTFTIMTFSVHVIDGLAALGVPLSDADAEAYFHLWRMYGELQGIRPEWMPATIADGRAFCRAYESEFRPAAQNPEGVVLTQADLRMMRRLLPWPLRLLGLGIAPRVYLLLLLGETAAERVGVRRRWGHGIAEWLVLTLPALWYRFWKNATPSAAAHARLSRLFFGALIDDAWGGEVRFSVPERLKDLRELA
jgi:hypothetical protein